MENCPMKKVREQLGISQTELAVLSDVTTQLIASVETGDRVSIPDKVLLALKTYANVDTAQLESNFHKWLLEYQNQRKQKVINKLKHLSIDII